MKEQTTDEMIKAIRSLAYSDQFEIKGDVMAIAEYFGSIIIDQNERIKTLERKMNHLIIERIDKTAKI